VFVLRNDKQSCDLETVKAVLGNRFQVMADYVKNVTRSVCREELHKIDPHDREQWSLIKRARFLISREDALLNEANRRRLSQVLDINPRLRTVYSMKQRLQDIWSRSASSQKERLKALEDWCRTAEASGVESLRAFSMRLRAYTLASAPA
jgi:stearoyl-CoA desaturase (delta-9 desaturase)